MNYIGSFIQYSKFQNTKGTYARGSTYYYGNIMEEPQNMNNMGINYVKATCNDISIVIPLLSLLNSAYLALHAKCQWFESYLLPFGIKYLYSY